MCVYVCICMYMYVCMYVCMYYVCVYVCMYVCMYACMYVYVYMYVCMCMYICMYVCICMYGLRMYVRMQVFMYVCWYVCVYMCTHVSRYVCICMYVCVYKYVYLCVFVQGWTNSRRHVVVTTKLCAVSPDICGFSVLNFLHVTFLTPRFFKNLCTPAYITRCCTLLRCAAKFTWISYRLNFDVNFVSAKFVGHIFTINFQHPSIYCNLRPRKIFNKQFTSIFIIYAHTKFYRKVTSQNGFIIYYYVTQRPIQFIVCGAILLHNYKNYRAISTNYDYIFFPNYQSCKMHHNFKISPNRKQY